MVASPDIILHTLNAVPSVRTAQDLPTVTTLSTGYTPKSVSLFSCVTYFEEWQKSLSDLYLRGANNQFYEGWWQ